MATKKQNDKPAESTEESAQDAANVDVVAMTSRRADGTVDQTKGYQSFAEVKPDERL